MEFSFKDFLRKTQKVTQTYSSSFSKHQKLAQKFTQTKPSYKFILGKGDILHIDSVEGASPKGLKSIQFTDCWVLTNKGAGFLDDGNLALFVKFKTNLDEELDPDELRNRDKYKECGFYVHPAYLKKLFDGQAIQLNAKNEFTETTLKVKLKAGKNFQKMIYDNLPEDQVALFVNKKTSLSDKLFSGNSYNLVYFI